MPRGREYVSLGVPGPLLLPGFGPGMPLRRGVSGLDVPAAGVEAASEALSTEDGGRGISAAEDAGDDGCSLTGDSGRASLLLLPFFSLGSAGGANRLNRSDDSFKMTVPLAEPPDRLGRRPFEDDGVAELEAGIVGRTWKR